MQNSRFFSFGQGQVGQYLSPRVLVVRTPFLPSAKRQTSREFCCFGFENIKQAQNFLKAVSHMGINVQLRKSQILTAFDYEIILQGETELARTLAFWDRNDRHSLPSPAVSKASQGFQIESSKTKSGDSAPAIAA